MRRTLRWKFVVILAVVISASAFAWVPPLADRLGVPLPGFLAERRLSLGLDLKGGVQFVLRVNAEEGLEVDATLTRDEVVAQAREAIDRRIDALGVLEPVIAVQGDRRDEILIQLPGFTDVERARAIPGQTARLEWRLLETGTGNRGGARRGEPADVADRRHGHGRTIDRQGLSAKRRLRYGRCPLRHHGVSRDALPPELCGRRCRRHRARHRRHDCSTEPCRLRPRPQGSGRGERGIRPAGSRSRSATRPVRFLPPADVGEGLQQSPLGPWLEVVGVVEDLRRSALDREWAPPMIGSLLGGALSSPVGWRLGRPRFSLVE